VTRKKKNLIRQEEKKRGIGSEVAPLASPRFSPLYEEKSKCDLQVKGGPDNRGKIRERSEKGRGETFFDEERRDVGKG